MRGLLTSAARRLRARPPTSASSSWKRPRNSRSAYSPVQNDSVNHKTQVECPLLGLTGHTGKTGMV